MTRPMGGGNANAVTPAGKGSEAEQKWPGEVLQVQIPSSRDGVSQPALAYFPERGESPVPLLVVLHSWSGDWLQASSVPYFRWCHQKGWAFMHPDFRGRNNRPEAAGSELVVQDILDSVEYAVGSGRVDRSRVYLAGSSGGGMAALLMAGRRPGVWGGVSAWVPVTDLSDWYAETRASSSVYKSDLDRILGGDPNFDLAAGLEARKRSPVTYLAAAKGVAIDVSAGINDGHTGSVPISHSLKAFNLLAQAEDRIPPEAINRMVLDQGVPSHLRYSGEDPAYGTKRVLLRRSSGKTRITIFQGGHEVIHEAALSWLEECDKTIARRADCNS